ncbi:MAG: hypothetical protein MK209_06045 [Planctomycetes bacterium]|nr:hypothetical protein [Planctomycetota bacterium]
MEFIAAFFIFMFAVAGMAVGVIFSDRKLQGSCGGVAADGNTLSDCLCERKKKDMCASDEGNELIKVAEMGWPKRKLHSPPKSSGSGVGSIEV